MYPTNMREKLGCEGERIRKGRGKLEMVDKGWLLVRRADSAEFKSWHHSLLDL